MKLKIFFYIIFFVFLNFNFSIVLANQEILDDNLILEEINYLKNNNQINFFNNEFKIYAPANSLKKDTKVIAKKITAPIDWPWNFDPLSVVYEFDLKEVEASYDRILPLEIEISYLEDNDYYKQIFFLDGNSNRWRHLPSIDYPEEKVVKTKVHFPFVRLAILYTKEVPTVGQASWYAFKNGLFAASPDFPKGSIIRVHNLANKKFVDVVINDYGPNRSIFPNRVIDLDAVAFNKIASVKDGLIEVKLEPKYIAVKDDNYIFKADSFIPEINAKSALVIKENNGEILFAKDAEKIAPLASLTKLLAARVFLDLGISLEKEIIYSIKDEEYNYQYVKPWESAKLRLNDGEIVKIKDLLYSSLIGSTNNAMESLVRASGLSRSDFIARMNIYAETWGAKNTYFVEPTGLSKENVSSPSDYAIIIKEIFKNLLLADISSQINYSFSTINTQRSFKVNNTNQLIRYTNLPLIGAKTGFINASGYCLFSRLKGDNDNLIIVSFASDNRENSFNDHQRLINYSLRKIRNQ
jgi:serine-type D-Ala-D-Ala endopeptidase (penicillin-binding protein 7)